MPLVSRILAVAIFTSSLASVALAHPEDVASTEAPREKAGLLISKITDDSDFDRRRTSADLEPQLKQQQAILASPFKKCPEGLMGHIGRIAGRCVPEASLTNLSKNVAVPHMEQTLSRKTRAVHRTPRKNCAAGYRRKRKGTYFSCEPIHKGTRHRVRKNMGQPKNTAATFYASPYLEQGQIRQRRQRRSPYSSPQVFSDGYVALARSQDVSSTEVPHEKAGLPMSKLTDNSATTSADLETQLEQQQAILTSPFNKCPEGLMGHIGRIADRCVPEASLTNLSKNVPVPHMEQTLSRETRGLYRTPRKNCAAGYRQKRKGTSFSCEPIHERTQHGVRTNTEQPKNTAATLATSPYLEQGQISQKPSTYSSRKGYSDGNKLELVTLPSGVSFEQSEVTSSTHVSRQVNIGILGALLCGLFLLN